MKTGCSAQLIWAYYYGKSIHTLKLCHIYNNQPQTYVSSLKILGALTSKQQPLHGNSQFIWNNQLKQKPVVFVSARSNIWASVQKNACQETKLHIIVWPHHAKDDPWRQHHVWRYFYRVGIWMVDGKNMELDALQSWKKTCLKAVKGFRPGCRFLAYQENYKNKTGTKRE